MVIYYFVCRCHGNRGSPAFNQLQQTVRMTAVLSAILSTPQKRSPEEESDYVSSDSAHSEISPLL